MTFLINTILQIKLFLNVLWDILHMLQPIMYFKYLKKSDLIFHDAIETPYFLSDLYNKTIS